MAILNYFIVAYKIYFVNIFIDNRLMPLKI
jgi:hypothetical protein